MTAERMTLRDDDFQSMTAERMKSHSDDDHRRWMTAV
jgi:hypothetical protein